MTLGTMTKQLVVYAATRNNAATLWMSVHDGDPGESGANELRGTPYERQSVRMVTRSEWRVTDSAARFILPDCRVEYLGLWDAKEGGSFVGGGVTAVENGDRTMVLGDTVTVPAGTMRIGVREGVA